jgi:guanine deaminase
MFDVIRSFVDQNHKKGIKEATYLKALYRSTLAGAEILGIHKKSGNLSKGKDATFVVVSLGDKIPVNNPELLLKNLITPLSKKRVKYGELVQVVYLKGKRI